MGNFLRNIILLAISLLVSFGLMELAVRALNLDEPLVWKPHAQLGWVHIPGAKRLWTEEGYGLIEINQLGYRDRDRTLEKPEGTVRIGVFGDSQTEAVQVHVDEAFTYLLEDKFADNDRQIEVLNFGTNGFSPTQELLLLEKEIGRYDLDIVVTALFLDNDVSGSIPELSVSTSGTPFIKSADGELEFDFSRSEESYNDFKKQPKAIIREYSGVYRFIAKLKRVWQIRHCGEKCSDGSIPTRYEPYLQSPPAMWESAWSYFERSLLETKKITDAREVPLLFLSIPAAQVVNQDAWLNIVELNPAMVEGDWNLHAMENRLERISKVMGVPLVQPVKESAQHPERTTFYFGNVGHLTVTGHQEIAAHLWPALSSILSTLE